MDYRWSGYIYPKPLLILYTNFGFKIVKPHQIGFKFFYPFLGKILNVD